MADPAASVLLVRIFGLEADRVGAAIDARRGFAPAANDGPGYRSAVRPSEPRTAYVRIPAAALKITVVLCGLSH
jgi:hypothetical protein